MGDVLSILTHSTLPMAKTWSASGDILPYGKAKNFTLGTAEVSNINELSEHLSQLEKKPNSFLIRGHANDEINQVQRNLATFDDQPLHTVLIEVDKYIPICGDPLLNPEICAEEYIFENLPACFSGVSFHWQLSNSAGHHTKKGQFRAHLWFWLKTPLTSGQLRQWSLIDKVHCDRSVFNPVQVHYTALPRFEEGVVDPVQNRSGFVEGVIADEVDLCLSFDVLRAAEEAAARTGKMRDGQIVDADDTVKFLDVLGYGKNESIYISCPFKDGHSCDSGETETVYFPAGTGGYVQGHFKCLHDSCGDYEDEDFLDALGVRAAGFDEVTVYNMEGDHAPIFKRNKVGEILATRGNMQLVLQDPRVCGWDIRYDNFRGELVFSPLGDFKSGKGAWRAFRDEDYFYLCKHLEDCGFKTISKELAREAIGAIGRAREFDSAIEWGNSLVWDGVPRVEKFLQTYFGVDDSDNAEYVLSVNMYIWTALAGRTMVPGIKADMVPVLIGEQGAGKSNGISLLTSVMEEFANLNPSDKDADIARLLRGVKVVEMGELRGLANVAMESVKELITRTVETWVPKYKEFSLQYPRRCLIFGSTNQLEFLADTTGNRRWLPVKCGKVDFDAIVLDRDQLWAEGFALFKKMGVAWSEAQELGADTHNAHRIADSWSERIEEWLNNGGIASEIAMSGEPVMEGVRVSDVAQYALKIDVGRLQRAQEMRISAVLNELGYVKKRVLAAGSRNRVYAYCKGE